MRQIEHLTEDNFPSWFVNIRAELRTKEQKKRKSEDTITSTRGRRGIRGTRGTSYKTTKDDN